ncbi:MAG TPA: oligosaccharide flippase family protein [Bacteroidia bacterium]|nr:oligosaccharide flippase family protein [Bacteroidia bacterium]
MNPLKKLAGQTAVYGMSTIFGRLLTYALTPFYTYIFGHPADFGINTEFYAYMSFLNVFFTYGMETGLFNFSVSEQNKGLVYSTALRSLFVSTVLFTLPVILFAGPIADVLRYPGHGEFVIWVILIVATDALTAIPFAKLREQNKAKRFATVKLVNIAVNLLINFFLIGYCKWAYEHHPESFWGSFYNPAIGIGYAFVAQLIANCVSVLLLLPELVQVRSGFNWPLWKRMMGYSMPLLVVGLAGMTNETMDRILLKYLLPADISEAQVGIYGACYKISILMTIFIQAFKYAAEPFFFAQQKEQDAHILYGRVLKYFLLFCLLIFLGTTLNLSWIQYFVGKRYRVGIPVVPILLFANLCLGMYFNLSIWYKLTGRTRFGMWLTLFGALITLVLNFAWIPSQGYFHSYMGSAWATLICYAVMMVLSYIFGQRYYHVKYDLPRLLMYTGLALALFFAGYYFISTGKAATDLLLRNLLFIVFILVIFIVEKPGRLLRRTSRPTG